MSDEKINGHPLGGAALEKALEQDQAQRAKNVQMPGSAERVWTEAEVAEANQAPCPICGVHEHRWCVGAGGSTNSTGEWTASSAHVKRLEVARNDISLQMELKLAALRRALPIGEALKAATHKWNDVVAYTDLVLRKAMAETIERVARELNVDPAWLVSLSHKITRTPATPPAFVAPAAPTVAIPPLPREARMEARVDALEAGVRDINTRLENLIAAVQVVIDRSGLTP